MINNLPKLNFSKKRTIAETCPCGKDNKDGKFTPYVDFVNCGYCHSCGKTFLPPIEKENNTIVKTPIAPRPKKIEKPISLIPVEVFKKSLTNFDQNHFVQFLISRFGIDTANEMIGRYYLGSSKYWSGANVFWQIDINGKIRTGKIMLYSPIDGKRIKHPKDCIQWVHNALKQVEFELKQCFFGEHLLKDKTKTVAIVESEKTAIISSIYLPKFIWLAIGGKTNLTAERMKVLHGRKVVLFPDLNCFDEWQIKAKELSKSMTISVSDLLERKATTNEKKAGLDLADYLLKNDWILLKKGNVQVKAIQTEIIQKDEKTKIIDFHLKQINHIDENTTFQFILNRVIEKGLEFTNVDFDYLIKNLPQPKKIESNKSTNC